MERRDVVIVGGGPAGITTALAHAHAGGKGALVLEKARYPREKYCAGAVGERGLKILRAMDAVPDVPHADVRGISFRVGGGEVSATLPASIGRVVRRIEFDHALANIAMDRGVEVRDGTRVDEVRADGDGAIVATSSGEIRARVVVGADGVGSAVRKAMGLGAGKLRAQVLELDTEPVPGERDRALLHFDASDRGLSGYTWDFPTVVNGQPLVCRGIYRLKVDGSDQPIEEMLGARLAAMGLDIARYKNKRYAERGLEPRETLARGPLMLVGEAAGIDPVSGEGIAQAIEYGDLAGRLLAKGGGPAEWPRAMARSRLAFDLGIRRRFVSLFYGSTRDDIERFLMDCPDWLHVGIQHFANERYDRPKLARVLAHAAPRYAAIAIRRALSL